MARKSNATNQRNYRRRQKTLKPASFSAYKPRPINAPLGILDLELFIRAHDRYLPQTRASIGMEYEAAKNSRRRLIHHGLLAPTSERQPMKWTHDAIRTVARITGQSFALDLQASADQHRKR